MKQLIVLAGVLPLLLVFMMQYTLDQKNSASVSWLQEQVYTAKEQAKQEGYFSEEITEALRENISRGLGISPEEVVIVATDTPRYRVNSFAGSQERGLIEYSVSVPIEKVMAGGRLFGIREEENRAVYTIEGVTASERLEY
ncbi:MAG: hypothetical protein Q4C22_05825 [Bacillota bacterium]|nr:hypothetical protein [Bacillota bacterium]